MLWSYILDLKDANDAKHIGGITCIRSLQQYLDYFTRLENGSDDQVKPYVAKLGLLHCRDLACDGTWRVTCRLGWMVRRLD